MGQCALLFVSLWGISLPAQQPAPGETPAALPPANQAPGATPAADQPETVDQRDKDLHPLTAEQIREQQIRQFDPLDRSDDKAAKEKDKEKAARDQKKDPQTDTPLPGSIAASERDAQRTGPRVAESDATDEPVQDYTGPAVLSRSYSVNRPMIPQELKWTESVGVNAIYDSEASLFTNGSVGSSSPIGTSVSWSIGGRHFFQHDQIGFSYNGNYTQYTRENGLNGSNNSAALDYSHYFSRRLSMNLGLSGSVLSQNYALNNPEVGPDNNAANVNLGTSPNIEITDNGIKQASLQGDLVWQQTARLSFDGGASYFAVERDTPGLLGMTGRQAHTDVNYRLTRQMTVGAYYSVSDYLYPHGFGTSTINTAGGIFSYAFSRTLQLRLRGGTSRIDSLGFQQIPVAPALAALLGQGTGIVDVSSQTQTSDLSAQIVKDFGRTRTVNVAFAHGVAPGNGYFQTSTQETISAAFAAKIFRRYNFTIGPNYSTLSSLTAALGAYKAYGATMSFSRAFSEGLTATVGVDYHHYDVAQFVALRNEVRITSGISWGHTGSLLPF
ncbi:MAG TPA: outer membrane beta-barrel protein [Bryobacteraceae bacterium]